ncbi:2-C-methyl-D-erythritol 2,4-cyclodiphosphate synthase [Porphyromonas levii]|uniref:2-C-methyl-D-erythritol 2,4-cyclodiphosphate synthase n=1 Tax=Porphyromonas levii TaxID=28114 RepID=UPI001BA85984|nr:2-C-methyl-D-erythritol 2,4-cyclodiphosphate synthase [Porphyromonas levii]MBR8765400.1 2-C-methyl-D-erythritol 2,4-cyclodiphosphate synthase [Porphyromonas levii]MBR8802328.1 2-C-methyl-D-erythritol 2,4-cyclodiphosphate synthase [Porphyromonas levii]
MKVPYRIGQGYDVHRFEEGRELWLGGVKIDYPLGLKGHSDADVLLHAISDALLGALALRDIGYHFPDTDPKYKGADSKVLLKEVGALVAKEGYKIGNIDATIVAEQPKINPHVETMQSVIAGILSVEPNQISIKATTNEKMGFTGRQEGILALATALVYLP